MLKGRLLDGLIAVRFEKLQRVQHHVIVRIVESFHCLGKQHRVGNKLPNIRKDAVIAARFVFATSGHSVLNHARRTGLVKANQIS